MPSFSFFRISAAVLLLFLFSSPAFSEALPEVKSYDQLVHAIREARAASQSRIEQAIDQEKVREAWETGKLIDIHVLLHKERANYDQQILVKLAADIETSQSELYYMLRFARVYPILPAPVKLTWAHYRELLSIHDEAKRSEIAGRAVKEKWGHKRIREEVSRLKLRDQSDPETETLEATPGKLFTYSVVKAVYGPLKGQLVLDLGFSNYFQPEKINKFKEGTIITLEKGKLKKISDGEDSLFTYTAYVTEVLDGDTFKAVIDLGFKFGTVQTLRLRGLDAPEIESAEGKEAKVFVEKSLPSSGPIIIKTIKSDKYDRYLADVFVPAKGHPLSPDLENLIYLNNRLLDSGHALRVRE